MDLQNFSKFSDAIRTLNEQSNAYPINEAIKSSILRSLSGLDGWRGWRNSFFNDFYKKFKVDLNEVPDSLFSTVDAATAKSMMKNKESVMIFCLYDNWQNPDKNKKSPITIADFILNFKRPSLIPVILVILISCLLELVLPIITF